MLNDKILKEYIQLVDQIKKLETRKEEIRKGILAMHQNYNGKYQIDVIESKRTTIISLGDIEDRAPKLHKALFDAGCVKEVEYKRINIKEKS